MDPQDRKLISRRLGRVGWALLAYVAAGQLLGGAVYLIPGVADRGWLGMLLSYVVMFGLAPILMWLILRPLPKGRAPGLPLSAKALVRSMLYCVGVAYFFNMVTAVVTALLQNFSDRPLNDVTQNMVESTPMPLLILLAGVAAPVFEELIFRKLLLDRLRPFGDRCAILLCGVAFGLYHVNLGQFFYAAALGMVLAGIVLKTGKIWHSMVCHAALNLSSLGFSVLYELGKGGTIAAGVIVVALVAFAAWCFVRYARSYRHAPPAYPVSTRDVMRCLPGSVGIWACAVLLLAAGVGILFI